MQYKLLISGYMTKDEYKQLIKKYMDGFNASYIRLAATRNEVVALELLRG